MGIACCIILGLYLNNELSYDKHFSKHKNIFRVVSERTVNGFKNVLAQTSYALGPFLEREYTEVKEYVRFAAPPASRYLFQYKGKANYWENVYLVDDNVFNVFDHEILYGDPAAALVDPLSMAVSETFAKRYFNDENPIGKVVEAESTSYTVSLVFADLPANTHLKYDVLLSRNRVSMSTDNTAEVRRSLLRGTTDYTYLVLDPTFDARQFRDLAEEFFEKYVAETARSSNSDINFYLEPLASIHLHSETERDLARGNTFYVFAVSAIAAFVLIVACINYVNLSTARSTKTAREVAIEKVLGVSRNQLVVGFLAESVCFCLLALLGGVFLYNLTMSLGYLPNFLTPDMSVKAGDMISAGSIALGGVVLLGLASGTYPAFILSTIEPVKNLRASKSSGSGGAFVRKVLVFLQYVVSVGIISSAFLMHDQIRYVLNKPLGFDKENKITMVVYGADNIERLPFFLYELQQSPGIVGATSSQKLPGELVGFVQIGLEDEEGKVDVQSLNFSYVDASYLSTMGIKLVSGRDFNSSIPSDISRAAIVNQALVSKMGWSEPIGKSFSSGHQVIGVVEDYHFLGLRHKVEPLVLLLFEPTFGNMNRTVRSLQTRTVTVSLAEGSIPKTLQLIEDSWRDFDSKHPFEFQFLDDKLDNLYVSDQLQLTLVTIFTFLCIVIASLGLLGLTSYTIERRLQEISIRKVLGASVYQITILLTKSTFKIILLSSAVASVISYWAIRAWLNGFQYHDDINFLAFVYATVISIAMAALTMAILVFKAGSMNPVVNLRCD
jgi:putative ABC transport system permease protein